MSDIKAIANSFAEEYCRDAIYPSHLFKAVLHKSVGFVHFLETDLDKDYYYLQEWADIQMQLSPRAPRPQKDLEYSPEAKAVMEEASVYQEKFGLAECEPICVLTSLVTPGVGFTFEQLKTLPLTVGEIQDKVGLSDRAASSGAAGRKTGSSSVGTGKNLLGKYCIDQIEAAKAGKMAPVIGFENEISVIFEILGRKTKSNLLITGELEHVMFHPAHELGVPVLALGHYATETVGPKAVMARIREVFGLECEFADLPTGL